MIVINTMKRSGIVILAALALAATCLGQEKQYHHPDLSKGEAAPQMRDAGTRKLSADLQSIIMMYQEAMADPTKGDHFSRMMAMTYGADPRLIDPVVQLVVTKTGAFQTGDLPNGVGVMSDRDGQAIVSAPVSQILRLSRSTVITSIGVLKNRSIPIRAQRSLIKRPFMKPRGTVKAGALNIAPDPSLGTGKGTIVAVVDTGIDYTHPDFLNADGTTRLLYIYDPFDNSFTESGGTVGSKPPLVDGGGKPIGTLYTRDQINAALQGKGTVNHKDIVGHGTACMSVAAGKGSGMGDAGIAPDADLIAVKTFADDGGFFVSYTVAVQWMIDVAKTLKEPLSINMSFGSQHGAHDGSEADELALNKIVGPLAEGVNICVSAGNEGRDAFHASATFGPETAGQVDTYSEPIELLVTDPDEGEIQAYFNHKDEWGFIIDPKQPIFTDDDDEPVAGTIYVYKQGGSVKHQVMIGEEKAPEAIQEQFAKMYQYIEHNSNTDRLEANLPSGSYILVGFGASANVTDGTMNVYAPNGSDASFAKGALAEYSIGSPGNALNVVTVGSYTARNQWTNMDGGTTTFNLQLGGLSNFSSPGPRIDGEVKPTLCAPGQYLISALAKDAEMGLDSAGDADVLFVCDGGKRIAWQGTSASTPYTTGVVALMLAKNPKLTGDKIIKILSDTATSDNYTRGTPNPYWGHGKLNVAAAIAAAAKAK
jgi:subtilisin family serine protease